MIPRIQPINPARIQAAFDHEDFLFELKHDGFRAVAYIENGSCSLLSRKQIQYKSFVRLSSALAELPVKNAILDGEIVCLDQDGRSLLGRSGFRLAELKLPRQQHHGRKDALGRNL